MKNVIKKDNYIYEFEGDGLNDEFGISKICGLFIIKNVGLAICFDKIYEDRKRAGQVGKYDLLISECYQNREIFEGEWYHYGLKDIN